MAEPNPNPAAGGVPPKPSETTKVQPKKETVRITLPPKAGPRPTTGSQLEAAGRTAAPEAKLAGSTTSINLVVPQIKETESSVKIPGAAEVHAAAPGPQPYPKHTPPSAPITNLDPPKPGTQGLALASKTGAGSAAAATPASAPAATPAKSRAAGGGAAAKTSAVDVALSFLAAAACIAFAVRLYLLLQAYS